MRQNAFSRRPTINASRHLFHFDGVTESVTKVFSRAAQLRPLARAAKSKTGLAVFAEAIAEIEGLGNFDSDQKAAAPKDAE
jgi:hypothetical protein